MMAEHTIEISCINKYIPWLETKNGLFIYYIYAKTENYKKLVSHLNWFSMNSSYTHFNCVTIVFILLNLIIVIFNCSYLLVLCMMN